MINKRLVQRISITSLAVLMVAGSAMAGNITYTTNGAGTHFVGGGLTLAESSGVVSTLTYVPNTSSISGTPSGINLGDFLLACTGCIQPADTATYGAFVFDLLVTDTTDNATGIFIGTSTGGTVTANSTTITITWTTTTPGTLQLGPGALNAISGNFGSTIFDKLATGSTTILAAPNSGTPQGDTTVQGQLSSTPEPKTFVLLGGGLLAMTLMGRKKFFPAQISK